jgi:hypothetical protein
MKVRVVLKDPDSMPDAVSDAVKADLQKNTSGISDDERESLSKDRASAITGEIAERWMRWAEYLVVEFDTDTWTATVLPASEMD